MLLRSQDAGRNAALRLPPDKGTVASTPPESPRFAAARVTWARAAQTVRPPKNISRVDPALNARVAGAQQSLDYLDRLAAELGGVRAGIRDRLQPSARANSSADPASPYSLEAKIQRFAALWSRRITETAGALDSRLEYHADGIARQTFKVRGLEFATLRAGNPEIISLSVSGQGLRGPASAAVEPGLSDQAIAGRFDRALAGSGIRALIGEDGELHFSVAESDWPKVRDSLSIRGEGQRFPTGRFSQVRVVADPPAIRPQDWKTHDEDALRSAREGAFMAEGAIRRARNAISELLADTSRSFEARDSVVQARAREVMRSAEDAVRTLAAAASGDDYGALAAVLPAVSKVDRDRVVNILRGPGAR